MLALQAIAVLNYSTEPVATNADPAERAAVAIAASPSRATGSSSPAWSWSSRSRSALVYRYTRFGLATRAGAENDRGAALTGISANRIAAQNWVIATVLAGVAGILIAPVANLDPTSYTLFIVPALACRARGPVRVVLDHRAGRPADRVPPVGAAAS